ncbi:S-layer homology domain-containing protein [uncultured Oscillibacter sp.]|uniref:S-layer homology domain-containing protein n=1 Tax=uncultured Oscillibacter sp. TaxID=876091 RepID=UPI0025F2024A|nr:S-layer homology domain-containing protein [uncultured Oscillibacter sp.]
MLIAIIFTGIPTYAFAQEADVPDSGTQISEKVSAELPFADVNAGDWFYDAVKYAYENGIFSGTGADSFNPNGGMTRAMFVTVLGRFAGIDPAKYSGATMFKDVVASAYYAPYVAWAAEKEITLGTTNQYFDIYGLVTRQQMAVFAERFFKAYSISYSEDADNKKTPSDLSTVSSFARDAVLNLYRAGVFQGDANGNFNPKSTATRAAAAAVLKRVDTNLDCRGIASQEKEKEKEVAPKPSGGGGGGGGGSGSGASSYSISFYTDGGKALNPITVSRGQTAGTLPIPIKENAVFAGWYTDAALSNSFDENTVVTGNLTLYAKYIAVDINYMNNRVELFSAYQIAEETPVQPDFSISLHASNAGLSAEDVRSLLQFTCTAGVDDRGITVAGQSGSFTVSMDGGFKPGASYTLTLPSDGLTFTGKNETAREYSFSIYKKESDELAFNDGIIYIPANEISDISCNGEPVDSLSAAVYSISETGAEATQLSGSFIYGGSETLTEGNVLCVYSGLSPELEGTNTRSSLYDNIAYVRVKSVSGTTIFYESAEAEDVLSISKTAAIQKSSVRDSLEKGTDGFSFQIASLTVDNTWSIGSDSPVPGTIAVGDTIALYDAASLMQATPEDVTLGTVTEILGNSPIYTITCATTSLEQLQQGMNYYQDIPVNAGDLISGGAIDPQMLRQELRQQTLQSGIIDELAGQYALTVLEGDLLADQVKNLDGMTVLMSNGTQASAQQLQSILFSESSEDDDEKVEVGDVSVNVTIKSGGGKLGSGALVAEVAVGFDVTIKTQEEDTIKLTFGITFIQEIGLSVAADAGIEWGWSWCVPYPQECWVNASLDVKTRSAVVLKATLATESGDSENTIDISDKIKDAIGDSEESDALENVSGIYAYYQEFMENDLDYIQIIKKSLFKVNISLAWGLVQITVEPYFVVNAAANAAVTCELSYQEGTRYSFTARMSTASLTFNKTPILDKQFDFSLYLVGKLGLRVGIELELKAGLISTKLNSMGISAQTGLYIEWCGFFSYEYSRNFSQGTSTSVAQGAMYAELGVYLEIGASFQAGNGKWQKNFGLLSETFPLLFTNSKDYVYDFSYELDKAEKLIINKDKNSLPDYAFKMITLDLSSGESTLANYDASRFSVAFTNPAFSLNDGKIVVNTQEEYLESDLIITWKGSPLAFTSVPIKRSFRVIYNDSENPVEKGLLTVKVNNKPVWSQRVDFGTPLEDALPTQGQILKLSGYADYNKTVDKGTPSEKTVNLRYEGTGGYKEPHSGAVDGSREFDYELPLRQYTVTVKDIQKTDGSTFSQNFTAVYGESFDLSALDSTGTEKPGEAYPSGTEAPEIIFTKFFNVETQKDGVAAGQSLSGPLLDALAVQLLSSENYTYRATYVDNSAKVIYRFQTLVGSIEGRTEIIKRNTPPAFDYQDYVEDQPVNVSGYEGNYAVYSVSGDTTSPVTGERVINIACAPKSGYELTLYRNGGTYINGYTPFAKYETSGTSLPAYGEIEKENYEFAGWYENSDFSGNPVATVSGNQGPKSYYALWVAPEYTIRFSGAGEMEEKHTTFGTSVTLPERAHALEAFREFSAGFTGWNTSVDGTGVAYGENATFENPKGVSPDGVLTLYAQYDDFNVSYSPTNTEASVPNGTMALCSALYYNSFYPGTITMQGDIRTIYDEIALPDGTTFSGDGYTLASYTGTVFSIAAGNTVKIKNIKLRYGNSSPNRPNIDNAGTLTIEDMEITGASSNTVVYNGEGGKMVFLNVTFNTSSPNEAALIQNDGIMVLDNCLFEHNMWCEIINNNQMTLNNVNFNTNGLITYFPSNISNIGGELYLLNTSVLHNFPDYGDGTVQSTGGTLYIVNSLLGNDTETHAWNVKIKSADTHAYLFNSISGPIDEESLALLTTTDTCFFDDDEIVDPDHSHNWSVILDDPALKDLAATVHLDYSDLDNIKIGFSYDGTFTSILNGATADTSVVDSYYGGNDRNLSDNRVGAEYLEIQEN